MPPPCASCDTLLHCPTCGDCPGPKLVDKLEEGAAYKHKYELLASAVNEDTSECLAECDSHSHANHCPYVSSAKVLDSMVARLEEAERLASLVDTAELAIRGLASAKAKLEAAEKMADALRNIFRHGVGLLGGERAALAAWDAAEEGKP